MSEGVVGVRDAVAVVALGNTVHVYAGHMLFVVWILISWSFAFKYLSPPPATVVNPVIPPGGSGTPT